MAGKKWYIRRNGIQRGPYRRTQIKELVGTGEILPNDLLWRTGLNGWIRAGDFPKLFRDAPTPSFGLLHGFALLAAGCLSMVALASGPWSDVHATVSTAVKPWLTAGSMASGAVALATFCFVFLHLFCSTGKVPTVPRSQDAPSESAAAPVGELHGAAASSDAPNRAANPLTMIPSSVEAPDRHGERLVAPNVLSPAPRTPARPFLPGYHLTPSALLGALAVAGILAGFTVAYFFRAAPPPAPRSLRERLIAIGRKNDIASMQTVINALGDPDPATSKMAVVVSEHLLGVRYPPQTKSDPATLRVNIQKDWARTLEQLRRRSTKGGMTGS